jgi:protoheme IX farnesyltransferase
VLLWTPAHFWALALNRSEEYARAGIPMLPVVAGRAATTRQILIYSVLLLPVTVLPSVLGFAGVIYGATVVICGAIFVALAWLLRRSTASDRVAANRLFAFSIFYLFTLFAALLASSGHRLSTPLAALAVPRAAVSATAGFLPQIAQATGHSKSISADEA